MDGKIFSKETKKKIVDIADDAIKSGILEPVDGPIISGLISILEKQADKVVPDNFDEKIDAAINKSLDGDFEGAAREAGGIIDELVDIKGVDDTAEKLMFVDGLVFIVRLVQSAIEKKRQ